MIKMNIQELYSKVKHGDYVKNSYMDNWGKIFCTPRGFDLINRIDRLINIGLDEAACDTWEIKPCEYDVNISEMKTDSTTRFYVIESSEKFDTNRAYKLIEVD